MAHGRRRARPDGGRLERDDGGLLDVNCDDILLTGRTTFGGRPKDIALVHAARHKRMSLRAFADTKMLEEVLVERADHVRFLRVLRLLIRLLPFVRLLRLL